MSSNPTVGPTPTPTQDLVQIKKKTADLDQLIAKYNQLYKTYLQQVEAEINKQQQRKYPYNIKNPNEFKNNLTPAYPFPSNGTEDACFKSCVDTKDCAYALYSNSGCGIDCNPNQCLLYSENAQGIKPVNELPSVLPNCPVSGNAAATDAWCKAFNNPVINNIIPVLVLRTGGTDWRSFAMQIPTGTTNAADAPMTVNTTTNLQTWSPDSQFSDVNFAPANEISLQFRFFAECWLNAYRLTSGSAPVIAGQGPIGTFAFAKLSPNAQCNWQDANQCIFNGYTVNGGNCTNQANNNPSYSAPGLATYNASDLMGWLQALYNRNMGNNPAMGEAESVYQYWNKCRSVPGYEFLNNLNFANPNPGGQASGDGGTSYVGTFGGQTMFWNSAAPSSGGVAAGLQTAAALASNTASSKFNRNYSAFEKMRWKTTPNMNAMQGQFPPQLAKMSIPSWQFLGVQTSAEACQRAATDDPAHVYDTVTYYNATYINTTNGNSAFANTCYGKVAGAPSNGGGGGQEDNVQSMTPPYGYTKLGGNGGIEILKQMYKINKQITALSDDLKIPPPNAQTGGTTKEGFTDQQRDQLTSLSDALKTDEAKINEKIQAHNQLDVDANETQHVLLYSRIKYGVAVVLGLLLAYFAYRFLTADELPETIKTEMNVVQPAATTTTTQGMDDSSGMMDDSSGTMDDSSGTNDPNSSQI